MYQEITRLIGIHLPEIVLWPEKVVAPKLTTIHVYLKYVISSFNKL
jgi:hypothetical protein